MGGGICGKIVQKRCFFLGEFHDNMLLYRVPPVWFGFGYSLGVEWFEGFRFSVSAVPAGRGFFCVSV